MRRFCVTTEIPAPAERVWEVMFDIERWSEWTPSITKVTKLEAGPLRIGSRVRIKQPRFPVALWTVTAIDEGASFTWVSRVPGLCVTARHSVEATPAGARATLLIEIAGLFGGIWAWLTRAITERYLGFEIEGLTARSRSQGAAAAAG